VLFRANLIWTIESTLIPKYKLGKEDSKVCKEDDKIGEVRRWLTTPYIPDITT